ncbi:MAG: hypothetical protein JNL32_08960, partial [Candidatus Kapabacteria bacterium]|nr:hypothetical protein [Candidatus Kapabacteria bacterium]
MTNNERIEELLRRVDALYAAHKTTSDEMREIRRDILRLQSDITQQSGEELHAENIPPPVTMQSTVTVVAAASAIPPPAPQHDNGDTASVTTDVDAEPVPD